MPLMCQIDDDDWSAAELIPWAETAFAATMQARGLDPQLWEANLLACSDARIATLNQDFRGKPVPTNVLSWPSEERAAAIDGDLPSAPAPDLIGDTELGDIAIAFGVCTAEAAERDISVQAHVTHLVIHGVLHLLGFDHERDADATLMEAQETAILGKLGYADPYSYESPSGEP